MLFSLRECFSIRAEELLAETCFLFTMSPLISALKIDHFRGKIYKPSGKSESLLKATLRTPRIDEPKEGKSEKSCGNVTV